MLLCRCTGSPLLSTREKMKYPLDVQGSTRFNFFEAISLQMDGPPVDAKSFERKYSYVLVLYSARTSALLCRKCEHQ